MNQASSFLADYMHSTKFTDLNDMSQERHQNLVHNMRQ